MKKIYKMLWLLALLAVMPVANVVAQNVAKIGDTGYATLADAVAAVPTDGTATTITMAANTTETAGIVVATGQNVVIDLKGKNITGSVNGKLITNNGTLTIKGTGCVYNQDISAQGHDAVYNTGTLVINGGIFGDKNSTKTDANDVNRGAAVRNYGGTATINGGSFTACDNYTNNGYAYALINDNNGTMTINNATVYGKNNGNIANNYGSVTVKGGTYTLDGDKSFYSLYVDGEDGAAVTTVEGGTFNNTTTHGLIHTDDATNASVEIEGGSFTYTNLSNQTGTDLKLEVSGGSFPTNVTAYMESGSTAVQNGDGSYVINPVAQIGENKYESLAAAVAAVPTDGTATTITIIANQTINVVGYAITIPATKNVVLDLNGFQVVGTVEQEGTSALIRNLGTLTIMDSSDTEKDGTGTGKLMSGADPTWTWDGTDDYSGSYASNLIRNEKNLTVESGLLYNMSTGSASYAIDNYSAGNVTINGGKVDAAKASAIRLFYINGGSITVTDGVIGHYTSDTDRSFMGVQVMGGTNANVSIEGGTLAGKNAFYASNSGGTMSITGGTFNGAVGSSNITGFISNGTFEDPVLRELCVQGKKCVEDNGKYIIVDNSDERESASINTVYYYWLNSDNSKGGGYYDFYAPFEGPDPVLMDGEFVELKDDVKLTKDVTYLTECSFGDPIYKGGTFTLTFGEYNIDLNGFKFPIPAGVTVKTDKQTDIFSAAEGYKIVETAVEGGFTYTVTELPSVAKIGDTKYTTLEEAIAAAQDGQTVTLLADVTLTDRLFVNAGATPAYAGSNNRYATTTENKSITLELDGHNITSTSNIALAGGSLNITNTGTADATHGVISTSEAGLAPVEVRGTGDLTAKRTLTVGTGVTLTGSTYGLNVFGSNDAQKNIIDVNVNGTVNGTLFVLGNLKNAENEININVNGTISVPNNDNNSAEVGIALNGNATVTVNEGANVSGETGIEVRAGKLIVNGGTITATASTYSYTANNSGSSTKGAAIAVAQHSTKLPIATTLNGGTLEGGKTLVVEDAQNNGLSSVAVTATKTYTQNAQVPEGYEWKDNGNGKYYLEATYVAQIGETKYASLAAAVAAATDGQTVTLLADVTLTDRLFVNAGANAAYAGSNNRYATTAENKSITLDMNGHNITSTSNSNIALAGGTLNITGTGTIKTTTAGLAPIEIRGTGDLTQKRTLTVGTGVTLTGSTYGLNVFGSNDAQKNIIDVNVDGTVNGTLFVLGNLKNAENEINIKVNGTIYVPEKDDNEANVGIALNGNATVTVNNGANVSGETGIEVRAGKLIVNGGTITATASTYSEKKNSSGSCTKGAAIAVAQHTTKLPIATTLSGGTLTGVEKLVITDVEKIGLNDVVVTATTSYTEQAVIPEGFKWEAIGENTYTLVEATDIELANNGDNSAVITAANGKVRNVTLKGRTLYKDNCWNTICLPFDVTINAESPLAGATVKELDAANSGYVAATNVLRINFKDAETDNDGNVVLKANTPYLLKWTSGNNVVAPVFNGVTVESGEAKAVSSDGELEFVGTASTVTLEGTQYAYFGNNNKLLYVDAPTGKKIYTCRAYFYLPNQDFKAALDETSGAKSFVLSFGDDDDDITRVAAVAGQQKAEDDVYYDLQGRKIVGQPTVSGIYVKNGVKVYVK